MKKEALYLLEVTMVNGYIHNVTATRTYDPELMSSKDVDHDVIANTIMRRYLITEDDVAINGEHVLQIKIVSKEDREIPEEDIPF